MVTGNEQVFANIDQAMDYVLDCEQKALAADVYRKTAPAMWPANVMERLFRIPVTDLTIAVLNPIPVDSLDYPLSAWFNNAGDDKFVLTRLHSGRYSLKPNLRDRRFLFRGETCFHQPCKPNMFRNPKQKRFTAEMARGQEMMLLMLSHPLVQLLDMGAELCGKVYQFEMNLFGLTQHYNNKTPFLDLTSNPLIAAFFATAEYNDKTDTYAPIVYENHEPGVLYYYSLDINEDFGVTAGGVKSPLSTIGLQVFPRSGRQKGFLYDLRTHENFNDVGRLSMVRFRHNGTIAKRICSQFHDGADIFPDDILMRHWRNIGWNSNVLSYKTVKMNHLFNPQMTFEEVETEIRSLGFEIRDYQPSFTEEELDTYYEAVQNRDYWTDFCNQIHIPGDRQGVMMNELLNLPHVPRYRWAFERDDSHVTDYSKGFLMRRYRDCLV